MKQTYCHKHFFRRTALTIVCVFASLVFSATATATIPCTQSKCTSDVGKPCTCLEADGSTHSGTWTAIGKGSCGGSGNNHTSACK